MCTSFSHNTALRLSDEGITSQRWQPEMIKISEGFLEEIPLFIKDFIHLLIYLW